MRRFRRLLPVFLPFALLTASPAPAASLMIVRDFMGGTPQASAVGSGNLTDIFNAAADLWEGAIRDAHTLTLHYGWAPVGGGQHTLNAQGGTPNRETEGTILFNNDDIQGHHKFWLDPTPGQPEEYATYAEYMADLGGGAMNVGRVYSTLVSDPPWKFTHEDLVTVALHEIGHALGLSMANASFIAEAADGDIDVQAPRPFAGSALPLAFNNFGVTSHFDGSVLQYAVMTGQGFNERRLISAVDIVGNAELSDFVDLGLVTGVGEPGPGRAPPANAILSCGPNPVRARAAIAYRLGAAGRVRAGVVSITGQWVRTLVDEVQSAGAHVLEWRADAESGVGMGSGVYFVQIACPDGSRLERKVTVLR